MGGQDFLATPGGAGSGGYHPSGLMSRKRRRRRSTPTPAQIWRILHSIGREVRIARREQARAEREHAEAEAALRRAFERRRAEDEERWRAEEQRWRAEDEQRRRAEDEKWRAENERRQAEEEKRLVLEREQRRKWEQEREKEERKFREIWYKHVGDGDNRWGQLMEALVEGNLVPLLRNADLDVERSFRRARSMIGGVWREYDLVALGLRDSVVVEVKATLRQADVKQFLSRIREFREWRPCDARERVWGALAYLSTNDNTIREAEAAGFYLIRVVGENARLVNSEGFQPRLF